MLLLRPPQRPAHVPRCAAGYVSRGPRLPVTRQSSADKRETRKNFPGFEGAAKGETLVEGAAMREPLVESKVTTATRGIKQKTSNIVQQFLDLWGVNTLNFLLLCRFLPSKYKVSFIFSLGWFPKMFESGCFTL